MAPAPASWQYDETARFANPAGIAVSRAGEVFVQDSADMSINTPWVIRKIALTGSVSTQSGSYPNSASAGMLTASAGNLYVLTTTAAQSPNASPGATVTNIIRIRLDGTATSISSVPNGLGANAVYLAADERERVYVVTRYRNTGWITRVDPDGSSTQIYRFSTWGDTFALASDGQGNLTLAARDVNGVNKLVTIPANASPAGDSSDAEFQAPPGGQVRTVDMPLGPLAYDAAGNLYILTTESATVTEPQANTQTPASYRLTAITIRRMAPDGTITTAFRGLPEGVTTAYSGNSPNYPAHIAVAADGTAFVTLTYDHTVYRISPTGQATLYAGKNGEAGLSD